MNKIAIHIFIYGGETYPHLNITPTSSEPSAQSWFPLHLRFLAMQRPLVQRNSLSEHWRASEEETRTVVEDKYSHS